MGYVLRRSMNQAVHQRDDVDVTTPAWTRYLNRVERREERHAPFPRLWTGFAVLWLVFGLAWFVIGLRGDSVSSVALGILFLLLIPPVLWRARRDKARLRRSDRHGDSPADDYRRRDR